MNPVENAVGRTMFFDFGTLVIDLSDSKLWKVNVRIWSATGQDFYRKIREVVLSNANGVVFVADAQPNHLQDNIDSWNELMSMITENKRRVPIIVCLNKQDLPEAKTAGEVAMALDLHRIVNHSYAIVPTSAKSGFNLNQALEWLQQRITAYLGAEIG